MDERYIQDIVRHVVEKITVILGADGSRGTVLAVFSGATVGIKETIGQLRRLVLDGYEVKMVFTPSAEQLYASVIHEGLAGFPHQGVVSTQDWLGCLKQVRGVIVPLLSVNIAAKIRMLIADNTAVNCILHGLFLEKPVVMARNGADPGAIGRQDLGFSSGPKALRDAMVDNLDALKAYGCRMTDVANLRCTVNTILDGEGRQKGASSRAPDRHGKTYTPTGPLVTAADINHAQRLGVSVLVQPKWRLTPMAQDLAPSMGS